MTSSSSSVKKVIEVKTLTDAELSNLPQLRELNRNPRDTIIKSFKRADKEFLDMKFKQTKEPNFLDRLRSKELFKKRYVFAPLSQNVNLSKRLEIVPIPISSLICPELLKNNKNVDTVKICDIVVTWQPKMPFNSKCKTYICFADFCLNKLEECYQIGTCFFTAKTCGQMIFRPTYPVSLSDNFFSHRFNLLVFTEGLDTLEGTVYATMPTFVKSVFYCETAIIYKGIKSSILNMLCEPDKKLKLITSNKEDFICIEEEKEDISDEEVDPSILSASLQEIHNCEERTSLIKAMIKNKFKLTEKPVPARLSFCKPGRSLQLNEITEEVEEINENSEEEQDLFMKRSNSERRG